MTARRAVVPERLGPELRKQLMSVGKLDARDSVQLLPSQPQIGASTHFALEQASAWRDHALRHPEPAQAE